MQQRQTTTQADARPRIVDLIAEGLSLAVARPWLLVVPILLDLYLWIGYRIEPRALMEALVRLIEDASIADTTDVVASLQNLAGSNMSQLGALFVPSMLAGVGRGSIYQIADPRVWSPASSGAVLLVALGLIVAGSLLAMIYTVPIANAILGRRPGLGALISAIARAWGRMLLFLAIVVAAIFAVTIPIAIIAAIFAALLPLLTSLLLFVVLAALLYAYFVFDAIVVVEVGPIAAIRYSAGVVHRNFRAAIGLVLATLLLTTGIPEIATRFLDRPPGLVLAVLIQALIATGATAASMFFFIDRLRRWRPDVVQIPHTAPAFDLTR